MTVLTDSQEVHSKLQTLRQHINDMKTHTITLVGDLMLDRYISGYANNLNSTAPVPVLKETEREQAAGAAAHVARGLHSLGLIPKLFSAIGDDECGNIILHSLEEEGISISGITIVEDMITTVKTRLIASRESLIKNKQLLMRWDQEEPEGLKNTDSAIIIERAINSISSSAALVISDYGKGVVTDEGAALLIGAAKDLDVPIICDPKLTGLHRTHDADVVLFQVRGLELMRRRLGSADFESTAQKLITEYRWGSLLVMGGESGVTLYRPVEEPVVLVCNLESPNQQIGLIDAAAVAVAASKSIGLDPVDSAHLANAACECILQAEGAQDFALTRKALATRLDEVAWQLQISQR